MATKKPLTDRAKAAIEEVASAAALPDRVTDVVMMVAGTLGGKLPSGDPSGVGGTTQFGVAWLLNGREQSAPIALYDNSGEADYLYELLAGPQGELWHRRERQRALLRELEEKEATAAAEAKADAKALAKASKASGSGSPQPKPSSAKRTTRPSRRSEPVAA